MPASRKSRKNIRAENQAAKQSWWTTSDAESVGPGNGIVRVIKKRKRPKSKGEGGKGKRKRAYKGTKLPQGHLHPVVTQMPAETRRSIAIAVDRPEFTSRYELNALLTRESVVDADSLVVIDELIEALECDDVEFLHELTEKTIASRNPDDSDFPSLEKLRRHLSFEKERRTAKGEWGKRRIQ